MGKVFEGVKWVIAIFGLCIPIYVIFKGAQSRSASARRTVTPTAAAPVASPPTTAYPPATQTTSCLNCKGARQVLCPSCHGTGRCSFCGGSGKGGAMIAEGIYGDCSWCRGTGMCQGFLGPHWDGPQPCGACYGTGQMTAAQANQWLLEEQRLNAPRPHVYNPNDPSDADDDAVMKILTAPQ